METIRVNKEPRLIGVFARAFILPSVTGLMLGFLVILGSLRLRPLVLASASLAAPQEQSIQADDDIALLIVDSSGVSPLGLWVLTAYPQPTGAVTTLDTILKPHHRTVRTILELALSTGDQAWIATNVLDIVSRQGPVARRGLTVIVLPVSVLESLIDEIGPLYPSGEPLSGEQAVEIYLSGDSRAGMPSMQKSLWEELGKSVRRSGSETCDPAKLHGLTIYPTHSSACNALVRILADPLEVVSEQNS